MTLQQVLCALLGHGDEHGEVVDGRWTWVCLRCRKVTFQVGR